MSQRVKSADGTLIAYETRGSGPPVILVDGALCYRGQGPSGPLADELASDFTVYTYDRRGRGESGDTPPYSVDREVEDVAALVEEAGGSAYLYGISSGAVLALDVAAQVPGIRKLAVYEAPFIVDRTRVGRRPWRPSPRSFPVSPLPIERNCWPKPRRSWAFATPRRCSPRWARERSGPVPWPAGWPARSPTSNKRNWHPR